MGPGEPGVEFLSRRKVCHEHGTDHVADLVEDGPPNQDVAPFDEPADALEVRRSNRLMPNPPTLREPDSTLGDAPKQGPAQEDEDPRVLSCLWCGYCDWDR